jgi:hypothetical protein
MFHDALIDVLDTCAYVLGMLSDLKTGANQQAPAGLAAVTKILHLMFWVMVAAVVLVMGERGYIADMEFLERLFTLCQCAMQGINGGSTSA